MLVGDWNAILDVCLNGLGLTDKRGGIEASHTCSIASSWPTGIDYIS